MDPNLSKTFLIYYIETGYFCCSGIPTLIHEGSGIYYNINGYWFTKDLKHYIYMDLYRVIESSKLWKLFYQ